MRVLLVNSGKGLFLMERENAALTVQQLSELKEQLLDEKRKIMEKYKVEDERFYLDKNEMRDVLDEASVNIQTSHELRFRNREVFYLRKINKALKRMDNETYGQCEDCSCGIGVGRLRARPTAELCILCKEENEITEHNTIFAKTAQSMGKTLSEL
jgi:DnaK suppressor protein